MAEANEMDLTFEDAAVGAWNVLSVAGELDMHTSAAMQERLDALTVGDAP
jgi:anti-anti-sigma regulatory factor